MLGDRLGKLPIAKPAEAMQVLLSGLAVGTPECGRRSLAWSGAEHLFDFSCTIPLGRIVEGVLPPRDERQKRYRGPKAERVQLARIMPRPATQQGRALMSAPWLFRTIKVSVLSRGYRCRQLQRWPTTGSSKPFLLDSFSSANNGQKPGASSARRVNLVNA
jgi:hypothetical protein